MTEIDYVTIPVSEYELLKDQDKWADALEAAGVDNWEGYSYAVSIYNKKDEI